MPAVWETSYESIIGNFVIFNIRFRAGHRGEEWLRFSQLPAGAPPRRAVTRRLPAAPLRRTWPLVAPRPPPAEKQREGLPRRRHAAARRQDGKMVVGTPTAAASRPLDARGLVHRLPRLCGDTRLLLRPLPGDKGGNHGRGHLTTGAHPQGARA